MVAGGPQVVGCCDASKVNSAESDCKSMFDDVEEVESDSEQESPNASRGQPEKPAAFAGANAAPTAAGLKARGEKCEADVGENEAPSEMEQLTRLLRNVNFLRERDIVKDCDLIEIAKQLLLESYKKGHVVFDYGEEGTKMYIILQGSISLKIPIEVPVSADE